MKWSSNEAKFCEIAHGESNGNESFLCGWVHLLQNLKYFKIKKFNLSNCMPYKATVAS